MLKYKIISLIPYCSFGVLTQEKVFQYDIRIIQIRFLLDTYLIADFKNGLKYKIISLKSSHKYINIQQGTVRRKNNLKL